MNLTAGLTGPVVFASRAALAVVYVRDVPPIPRGEINAGVAVFVGVVALAVAAVFLVRRLRRGDSGDSFVTNEAEEPLPPRKTAEATAEPPAPPALDHESIFERPLGRPDDDRSHEDLLDRAVRIVTEIGGVSIPALQRRLDIDYPTAAQLVGRMENRGYVSAPNQSRQRRVLAEAFDYVARLDAARAAGGGASS